MRLLTCLVTHDRVELTRACVESYLATVTVPFELAIIDNASSDGTRDYLGWLLNKVQPFPRGEIWISLGRENLYPGRACNQAWERRIRYDNEFRPAAPPFTVLHRSDNDVEYQPGWCDEISRLLADERVGQVGLLEEKYEQGCFNVGGNCVLRRELWDLGVRWDPQPWGAPGREAALNEDALMSSEVAQRGYRVVRVERECVKHLGWDFDAYPDYYAETSSVRGYEEQWIRDHFDRMKAIA